MIRNDPPSPRQYKGVMISSTFTGLLPKSWRGKPFNWERNLGAKK
ncbi:MAG TPA: hypothetical protein VEV42_10270 [Pyrinomonadaceae bacterium]|nr:hypothetical protein [Pyrinomonadaceae bacterium]